MKDSIEDIWKKFSSPLKHFIRGRVSNEFVTDDILQDVYTKMCSHIEDLKDQTKIEPWVYQITRNTIIDYYRTRKIGDEIPGNFRVSDRADEKIDTRTGFLAIKTIVNSLPQPYAQAILLTQFEGLTQKELALKLGLSDSGAKSRVQRARKMLESKLKECCVVERNRLGTIADIKCTAQYHTRYKKKS